MDPKFFHKLHIQSIFENLKLWTPISNPSPKPPTQLHMSQKYLVVSILPHEGKVVAILT